MHLSRFVGIPKCVRRRHKRIQMIRLQSVRSLCACVCVCVLFNFRCVWIRRRTIILFDEWELQKKKNGTKIGTTTKIDSAIVLPPLCFSIYLVLYSCCVYFSIGSRPTYAENAVMKKKQKKKTHAVRFAILMATHRQFIHSFHSFNDRNTSRMSFAQTR